MTIYDKSKPTCLATDWSKTGIGYWLFQKHCQCPSQDLFCCHSGWKITLVGSRFTHSAESRYAPIEGEALAVADALEKAKHFVLGCRDLTIAVDHKPLLHIFSDRSMSEISNTRLRNLKEKTLQYKFRMVHIPGIKNRAPDCISRHPTGVRDPCKMTLQDDISTAASSTTTQPRISIPSQLMAGISTTDQIESTEREASTRASWICALNSIKAITWDEVRTATSSDPELVALLSLIEDGIPDTPSSLSPTLRPFHHIRQHLCSSDGVILFKDRIVVPTSLRQRCLSALHAAHQGTSAMTARAESSIFWPGITTAIQATRTNCSACKHPTDSPHTSRVSFPVHLRGFLPPPRMHLPRDSRPIFKLADSGESNRWSKRTN